MTAAPLALAPDLTAGLKRLKLATIRTLAPELLQTAKTQRWTPEELLRTLVEAELAARDAANHAARLKLAGFPVHKSTLAPQPVRPRHTDGVRGEKKAAFVARPSAPGWARAGGAGRA